MPLVDRTVPVKIQLHISVTVRPRCGHDGLVSVRTCVDLQSRLQGDRLARRIPVPPGNQTMGQLLRPEIKPGAYRAAHPGAYRAGHSGVSASYYGSTQHHLAQKNDKDWTVKKRLLSARRASQMGVFDNEIERWGEVDVPYLPSQLIGSSINEYSL
ncbi:hypothetical protein J6590_061264 [Homalodisca vitripennis]|nr:hypothetical protein J6590_061264 [Homalodisca vitripennis]